MIFLRTLQCKSKQLALGKMSLKVKKSHNKLHFYQFQTMRVRLLGNIFGICFPVTLHTEKTVS